MIQKSNIVVDVDVGLSSCYAIVDLEPEAQPEILH